ncbi:alpha-amylase family glycosyl hydrolase [Mesoterricola sediminis]|uniref:Alpha-amylase n=1 Tax=Mesoterricola sediminis TaxID=2927980 RepID=A0AA48KEV9_9BACT|nr:alpha-amylase family glycosyl hydrolase [Mesoterricola sediminis]BDU75848.1 alpha-amylase [Mesoterricola sediminis]
MERTPSGRTAISGAPRSGSPRRGPGGGSLRLHLAATILLSLVGPLGCSGGGSNGSTGYPVDTTTIAPGQQLESPARWYDDAVIYQIWVKAFNDGLYGDGIGDLPGIQAKLDYLQSLGVNTLWLSPIFECAYKGSNMHGYDTTDYYAVNDRFGRKADLKNLIDAVHARGMRIIFDFVPNHTSTAHPWFTGSNRSAYYVWKSALPDGWGYPWGGGTSASVWTASGSGWYYTAFGAGMADLNFYDAGLRQAIQDVQTYWLDRGFDGMRVDAVRYLCETGPGQAADQPDTHARLQAWRTLLDGYAAPGNTHPRPGGDASKVAAKMMVAEAWTDTARIGAYFGSGSNEFHMCLDFAAPAAVYSAISGPDATALTRLWETERDTWPAGARAASFDSNHDNVISRPGTQYRGSRPQIVLAEAMNILGPATPILYYGNEVGMPGAAGNDADLRQPMDWSAVAAQTGDAESILSWCKYLIQARTSYPALRTGAYATLATDAGPAKALACLRSAGAERILVVANLTGSAQTVTVSGLAAYGLPSGTTVQAVLGDLKNNNSLNGGSYTAAAIPAYGVRVIYAGGGGFQGAIHGDIK